MDDHINKLSAEMNEQLLGISKQVPVSEDDILTTKKVGMYIPISWEHLAGFEQRKGHYETTGIKWIQYLRYLVDKGKFQVYRWLERSLHNSRHFIGPGGYDWDEADFKPFKQRMRWVSDE